MHIINELHRKVILAACGAQRTGEYRLADKIGLKVQCFPCLFIKKKKKTGHKIREKMRAGDSRSEQ